MIRHNQISLVPHLRYIPRMTLIELNLALLALLITPGPTNTLLALAGAQGGFRAGLRLLPVELLAYLCVVVPLVIWGAPVLDRLPILRPVLTGVAALWVARLAFGLWHRPAALSAAAHPVSAMQVGVTTLLNPKCLLFGLVLIPAGPTALHSLISFAVQVPVIAALWAVLGAGVLSRSGQWLNKGAAIWLALLSVLLAAKAFAG